MTPVRAADFDVFVLTYNRSALLPATLESLLSQSLGTPCITVLDNGSTDPTAQVVAPYLARGVRYLPSALNLGWKGNLSRAQQFAERPWTIAFHDDDLMHPEYLAEVAAAIERFPDAALVASGMSFESAPANADWPCLPTGSPVICPRPADLARLLYSGFPLPFCSAVYRSTVFRKLRWEDQYGKVADRPFLLDAAEGGLAIVLPDPFVRYRLHAGQDSGSTDSGPFVSELAALHAHYRGLLGTSIASRNGRTFLSQFFSRLHDEFPRLSAADRKTLSGFEAYVEAVRTAAKIPSGSLALSRLCWFFGKMPREFLRRTLRNE